MLLELFRSLADGFPALNVFNYLTLRAVLAALTSMGIGFALGPWMIARLKNLHFGQAVRTDGPKTHLVKDGTPTMGGALILFAITVSTLLWADLSNRFIWVVLFVTLGYGSIGWIDDYRKVVHHNPKGMSAREKFSWQSVIGLARSLLPCICAFRSCGWNAHRDDCGLGRGWLPARHLEQPSPSHPVLQGHRPSARPGGLHGLHVCGDRRQLQRREPHRRPRRSCHPSERHGGRCAGHLRLRRGTSRLCGLSDLSLHSGGGRTRRDRRGPARRRSRVPLVQRPSRPGLHGRRGRAGARRLPRHHGRHHPVRNSCSPSWAASSSWRRSPS